MHFKNIVIGNGLSSVLFAHYNDYPIILNSLERPFRFDRLRKEAEFSGFKTTNAAYLWSWAVYEISLRGLAPFGPCVSSLRIEGNNMSIAARQGLSFEASYDQCYIFEDDNVSVENSLLEHKQPLYRVFDWINVRTGTSHQFDFMETGDDFVKEIYFYKSERIDGDHNKKDLVAVSYLTQEQLRDFEYSDTMAKFKVESIMKNKGIIGAKSGKTKNGKQKKHNIKLEPDHRHMVNINQHIFEDTELVKFIKLTPEEVIKKYAPRR